MVFRVKFLVMQQDFRQEISLVCKEIVNVFSWSFFACNLENIVHRKLPVKRKVNVQVTTSDGKIFSDFEKIQAAAKKFQDTEIIKKSITRQDSGFVMYGGKRMSVSDHAALSAQIPNILDNMRVQSRAGKVYSKGPGFEREFAECLDFLLAWLGSVGSSAGVNALLMRNALSWLVSTARVSMVDADLKSVESTINNL